MKKKFEKKYQIFRVVPLDTFFYQAHLGTLDFTTSDRTMLRKSLSSIIYVFLNKDLSYPQFVAITLHKFHKRVYLLVAEGTLKTRDSFLLLIRLVSSS